MMEQLVSLSEQVIDKVDALKNKRLNFERLWQEVSELVLPRKADFSVNQPNGSCRTRKLFETTAINCAELLAAGLHGMMTNPTGKWFSLNVDSHNLSDESKIWIENAEKIIADEISKPTAAFATNVHEVYLDLAVLGTAGLYVGWNEEKQSLLFQSRFLGELFIEENAVGQIDHIYRVFQWSLDKIVQTWGEDALPEKAKFIYQQNAQSNQEYEIIHAIIPNPLYEKENAFQKPIASIYIFKDEKAVLYAGGFEEMPLFISRWCKASGEVYGRSPAISVLPDIKMLQEMMKETLISAQLANRPPLLVKDDDQFSPVATVPGGIIRYNNEPPKAFSSGSNSAIGLDMMNEIRQRLRTAFYNDVLITTGNVQMTATEVIKRTEEKMRLMGPVFGRLQTELLGPMIERVFGLLLRHGKLPPLPEEMKGKLPVVSYLSPLTMAQRQVEAQGLLQTLELSDGFLKIQPEAAQVFNVPETIRKIADMFGVSKKLIHSEDEILQLQKEIQNES